MACTQSTKAITSIPVPPSGTTPTALVGTKANTTMRFVISDNHETINSSTPFTNGFATLWHDTVSGKSSVKYRMFVWHLNDRGSSIKYGITIGNNNDFAYTISGVKSAIAVVSQGSIGDQGRCAAAALIGDTLDSISPVHSTVPNGQLGVVQQWTVPNGYLVGGIIEFTVTGSAVMSYRLRSVAATSTTADLRQNQTPVIKYATGKDGSIHPRGSWDFAEINSSVSYTAGSGWKYYNMSNGSGDNLMTSATSYDSANAAASNKGHYGVKYNLTVNLSNPSSNPQKTVKIFLASRVDPYSGAVKWSGENVTYKVPRLASPGTSTQEAALVATVTLAPGQSISRVIYASTAGGLSTPAVVAFQTV